MDFFRVLRYYRRLKAEQWDRERIERTAASKLDAALASAVSGTKFYGALRLPKNPSLEDFPILTKQEIQQEQSSFIRRGVDKSRLLRLQTSGSSGRPLETCQSEDESDYGVALNHMVQGEFGRGPFDLLVSITHAKDATHPVLSALRIYRKKALSVFEDERKNFGELLRLRPQILGWYPSVISALGRLNAERGKPLRLKRVFCASELLAPSTRRFIEDSFSATVFNIYGTSEFGIVAWECPEEHSLHVNSTSCRVEIVDSKGNPKKTGTGDILITGLRDSAMPLIRYRIGDRGSWGRECGCGRALPVLGTLEGRDDDFIVLPSGRVRSARSINLMDEFTSIRSYQIVQESETLFVFRYVPAGRDIPEALKGEIAGLIRQGCLGEPVRVEFQQVDSIQKSASGKIRTVVSKVKGKAPGL
ncbi:MAG: hypothetical protein AB1324_03970 [Candidatus Micrarchaeota archaeon]